MKTEGKKAKKKAGSNPGPEFEKEAILIRQIATPKQSEIVDRFSGDPIVEDLFVPFSEGKTKILSETIVFGPGGDCHARNNEGRLVQIFDADSDKFAEIIEGQDESDLELDRIANFYVKDKNLHSAFKAAIRKLIDLNCEPIGTDKGEVGFMLQDCGSEGTSFAWDLPEAKEERSIGSIKMNANRLFQIKKDPMNRSFNESSLRMKIFARNRYQKTFSDVSFKGVEDAFDPN